MTISETVKAIRNANYECAVYLSSVGGQKVDILRLRTNKQKRKLDGWLRDKHFLRNFVGVYDRHVLTQELWEDVHHASLRQMDAA